MRVRALYDNIPGTLTEQLQMLVKEMGHDFGMAVAYAMTPDFTKARGFSDALTEQQIVREMHEVIRNGMG